ncbi:MULTISPECIES: hypothetical protein [unclassified Chryseobacterium]|uniref:hypothetical protein n=1 Tax=unclassified Chryseobacterium TaxID=2593645 RepID=UPI0006C8BF7E|nr:MULTISPECIES: hypothetical protein [unclassified Chryseobacterium]AZA54518.1 hypothetical protein EG348_16735 [Chryseobacterium sp. G0201]
MEKFLEALKKRAGSFLLKMEDFKPFSTNIRVDGQIIDTISNVEPCSIEEQYLSLLNGVQQDLKDSDIQASAIVLAGKADGYDVVLIEIFTALQKKYQLVFPYTIAGETVTFGMDLNREYHGNSRKYNYIYS